jgi:hypothetical protein
MDNKQQTANCERKWLRSKNAFLDNLITLTLRKTINIMKVDFIQVSMLSSESKSEPF